MTASTGKAPCVFCHDTKSQCVLIKSRRGGNFRQHQHKSGTSRRQKTPLPTNSGESNGPDVESANSVSDVTGCSSDGEGSVGRQNPGDVLAMELRNPSDALQILAMSDQVRSGSRLQAQFISTANLGEQLDAAAHRTSASDTNQSPDSQCHQRPSATIFDDYELVKRGVLRPSLLSSPLRRETIPTIHSPTVIAGITPNASWLMYSWHTPGPKPQQLSRDCCFWRSGFPIFKFKKPHLNPPKIYLAKIEQLGRLLGSQFGKAISSASTRPPFVVLVTVGQSNEQSKTGLSGLISVRLGQSFWSRGPSLATKFTADDFPSLQPRPENDNEDYASWLQASMELIQILHNAHAILYSSKDRTLAMVYEGDYARYLDDFRTSATTWRSAWGNLAVSAKIRTTLLIMYEYICLYTNAFSFQAVLTRASRPHGSSNKGQQNERPFADILSKGIMASPDGRYIFDAISAAMNLLALMNSLDPQHVLCYLPSRYYL
ncbi:hypothetical protein AtubIFM61612_007272 [Aspergillus tubingensis]|nr:hypothetical protein AtubIFM61612_007272 [Aspergillus tubingensis]